MESQPEKSSGGEARRFEFVHAYYFLFGTLFLVIWICYNILQPYLHTIILGAIIATLFLPIHRRIERRVAGRENLAAIISCVLVSLLVIVPLAFLNMAMIREGIHSFNAMYDWIKADKYRLLVELPWVKHLLAIAETHMDDVKHLFPGFDPTHLKIDELLLQATSTVGQTLVNQGRHLLANLAEITGKFILMIFVFFFFVRDHDSILDFILHLLPLSSSHEQEIVSEVRSVARSALLGSFVTAAAQGAAGGVAFWIVGLPGLFWGTMMAFASLIPVVGTALIWLPASGYLFLAGQWKHGLFLLMWCVVVVGMIDNFVRPVFMKDSSEMSSLLVFLSILGGVDYFGLIGVLYGPMIFGLALVLLYIYALEFRGFLDHQDRT